MSVNPLLQVQKVTLSSDSLRFITPCSISVAGPSQSEIKRLLRHFVYYIVNLSTSEMQKFGFRQFLKCAIVNQFEFQTVST